MNEAAGHFTQRVLARQAMAGLTAFAAVAGLSPPLLLIEHDVVASVLQSIASVAALALAAAAVLTVIHLRAHRYLLRALALGSTAVEPDELGALGQLPGTLTYRFFGVTALFSTLLLAPGLRPDKLDGGRAVSLFILAVTILGAAAIPHYVLIRAATVSIIELGRREQIASLLETWELRGIPERRMVRGLRLAVIVPVALISAGAVLVAHAHLRTFIEESGKRTAVLVASTALEPAPGALSEAGRADAIAAAGERGFLARIERGIPKPASVERDSDGQLAASTPLEDGQAVVRFSADLGPAVTSGGAAIGLFGVLLAGLLGALLGRALTRDLVLATRGVRLLGTDAVLRGSTRIARPARFDVVQGLSRAIEVLTDRFGVFAAAQERALDAREAAQRMRGLLFASMSHDLKSPLNAVLGFAELLGQEDLTPPQRENLAIVATRGRELLALIETILDAARVEAGQLELMIRAAQPAVLVTEAVRKARDLVGDAAPELVVEVSDGLPEIPADPAYLTRALAVIVAHAMRVAAADPNSLLVRVRAALPAEPGTAVRVSIEHGSRAVRPSELEALFARQSTSRGRGLTLGLSLARAVIELHGGTVEVDGAPNGAPVAHCWLPLVAPRPGARRGRLSSRPALG